MSDEVKARYEAAMVLIDDLNHQRRAWVMSIPARPDYDPDLVISAALNDIPELLEAANINALFDAFVAGVKWWEIEKTGATMWQSDQNKARAYAAEHYPFTPLEVRFGEEEINRLRAQLADTQATAVEMAFALFNLSTLLAPDKKVYAEGWRVIVLGEGSKLVKPVDATIAFLLKHSLIEKHPERGWYRRVERGETDDR